MAVLLLFAAAAAAAGAGAAADQAASAAASRFARLDRNGDGVITANEAPRVVRTRCDCLGAPAPQPASGSWLADFDRDGDARVTADEYAARSGAQPAVGAVAAQRGDPPLR